MLAQTSVSTRSDCRLYSGFLLCHDHPRTTSYVTKYFMIMQLRLRSLYSSNIEQISLVFHNASSYAVRAIWITFDGAEVMLYFRRFFFSNLGATEEVTAWQVLTPGFMPHSFMQMPYTVLAPGAKQRYRTFPNHPCTSACASKHAIDKSISNLKT